MRKFRFSFLTIVILFLAGCELIKLTEAKKKQIPLDPTQSIGTVALLVNELKQNNIDGSLKLFILSDTSLNSEYFFELKDRLERFGRNISNRSITYYKVDTLNPTEHLLSVEFDYIYDYFFIAQKNDDIWLIRSFGPKKQ